MTAKSDIIQPLGPDDQLFFIHIPKTAGTTFNDILHTRYTQDKICPVAWPYPELLKIQDQLPKYKLIRGHFPYRLVEKLSQMPICVTFLRNPLTQTLSFFDQMQRGAGYFDKDKPAAPIEAEIQSVSFEEFLLDENLVPKFSNTHVAYFSSHAVGPYGIDLELAKRNLASIPFVGITEEFSRSMELFTYTFDLSPIPEFSNKNISPRRDKRATLIEKYREVLEKYNAEDMEFYEFGRQLFEERYAAMQAEKRRGAVPAQPLPMRDTIYTNLQQVDPGVGWHIGEYNNNDGYSRWTGPQTTSWLTLNPFKPGRDYVISFRVVNTIMPEVIERLQLEVNGVPIDLSITHEEHSRYYVEGVLPASVTTESVHTRLCLTVSQTFSPAETGINAMDERKLGIKLQWIHIYPR